MFKKRGAERNEKNARFERAAKAAGKGAKGGLSRIKLNKTQASFVLIAFAAAVCAAAAVGLALNSFAQISGFGFSPFGGNAVILEDFGGAGITLSAAEEFAQKNEADFEAVVPLKTADGFELRGGAGSHKNGRVTVSSDGLFEFGAVTVEEGAPLSKADYERSAALVSADVAAELFGEADPVGGSVKINNRPYTVVGIFSSDYDAENLGDVILPGGASRMIFGTAEVGRYAFIVSGGVSEVESKVKRFAESGSGRLKSGDFAVTAGPGDDSEGTGAKAVVYIVMLIICGIVLLMFLLFPSRRESAPRGLKSEIVYRASRNLCAALIPASVGIIVGAALGVCAAFAYTRVCGVPLFVSAAEILMPAGAALVLALILAAVSAFLRLGGDKNA